MTTNTSTTRDPAGRSATRGHDMRTAPHPAAIGLSGLAVLALAALATAGGLTGPVLTLAELVGLVALLYAVVRGVYPLTPRARLRAILGQGGWATVRHFHQALSPRAVRQSARAVRPTVAAMSRRTRQTTPTVHFGSYIGHSVVGPLLPRPLHCSYRDVAMLVAPPQTGKTALLGSMVLDAPGAVIVTSTKADIYAHTATLRAERGLVIVFDPKDLIGLEATFRWSPVTGCEVPAVAQERANYLIDGARAADGMADGGFFEAQAAKVLRAYLLAAALDGLGMAEVAAWAQAPGDRTPLRILQKHTDRVPVGWEGELAQVLQTNATKTRDSIYLTLCLATAFMGDPYIATACQTAADAEPFDVEAFVRARGTLYLLGSERPHSTIAPLLSCLTGYIFESAKRIAAKCEGGRLDPPVTFTLDEAALITPVPLHRWTSDSGGRGIHLVFAVQGMSQLFQRWGERAGQTIVNNANLKIVYNGLTIVADLDALSKVCGERERNGRHVRTLPPDRLRQLPQWHVLALYRFTPPTIVRITPVWERADVKALRRREAQASARAGATST